MLTRIGAKQNAEMRKIFLKMQKKNNQNAGMRNELVGYGLAMWKRIVLKIQKKTKIQKEIQKKI